MACSIKSPVTQLLMCVSQGLLPRLSEMRLGKGTKGWRPLGLLGAQRDQTRTSSFLPGWALQLHSSTALDFWVSQLCVCSQCKAIFSQLEGKALGSWPRVPHFKCHFSAAPLWFCARHPSPDFSPHTDCSWVMRIKAITFVQQLEC